MHGSKKIRDCFLQLLRTEKGPSEMCHVQLDRIQFVSKFAWKPPAIPGFVTVKDTFVRPQTDGPTYRRVRRLRNPTTGTQLFIQYIRTRRFLQPLKVTAVANDRTGIGWVELRRVVTAFAEDHHLTLIEVAFDFSLASGVTQDFVRRYGVFGKSRPEQQPRFPNIVRYGTRRSQRLVRSYFKQSVSALRVELEIHSRWLRGSHDLNRNIFQLHWLALFPNDFYFAGMDWTALSVHLRRRRLPAVRILREARERACSLHGLLKYLRGSVGIHNPDRFLRALKINREIARAWNHWVECFTWMSGGKGHEDWKRAKARGHADVE